MTNATKIFGLFLLFGTLLCAADNLVPKNPAIVRLDNGATVLVECAGDLTLPSDKTGGLQILIPCNSAAIEINASTAISPEFRNSMRYEVYVSFRVPAPQGADPTLPWTTGMSFTAYNTLDINGQPTGKTSLLRIPIPYPSIVFLTVSPIGQPHAVNLQ